MRKLSLKDGEAKGTVQMKKTQTSFFEESGREEQNAEEKRMKEKSLENKIPEDEKIEIGQKLNRVDHNLSNSFNALSISSSNDLNGAHPAKESDVEMDAGVVEELRHPSLWGFDEMFFGCNKMYISDVLRMPENPQHTGVYQYRTHPVRRVDIMGVIVSIIQKTEFFIYSIDDGTGVISCMVRKPDEVCKLDDMENMIDKLGSDLGTKLEDVFALTRTAVEGYSLGDVIQIKGKVKAFRDMREVFASFCAKVDDPMMELCHMSELIHVYSTIYDVAPRLPPMVEGRLTGVCDIVDSQAKLLEDLERCVNNYLYLSKSNTISLDCLLQVEDISKMAESKTIKEVLGILQKKGVIFPRLHSEIFNVTLANKELEDSVLATILTFRDNTKGGDDGCSCRHILQHLHKTSSFSRITAAALDLCLDNLEGQSKIISTSINQYIVFD